MDKNITITFIVVISVVLLLLLAFILTAIFMFGIIKEVNDLRNSLEHLEDLYDEGTDNIK